MKLNRNYVTPFISLVFLVVGLSGLLMFFHLFDGYTEVLHEFLGVFFIVCAIFHIMLNWKALKIHFKRGGHSCWISCSGRIHAIYRAATTSSESGYHPFG